MKLAINGFGRIGRQAVKIALENGIDVMAINDLTRADELGHLLKYDTVYGIYPKKVVVEIGEHVFDADSDEGLGVKEEELAGKDSYLVIDDERVKVLAIKDPTQLPWEEMQIDIVLECTGIFVKDDKAAAHLQAGAKSVVISAPSTGENPAPTFLIGVNHQQLQSRGVISNGSCTTNCVAPVTRVMQERFGIQKAVISTIHSVTADQNLVDGLHKDYRRGRSAMMNIIPTSSGSAISVAEAMPALKGKFDGMAFRVPTIAGSIVDFTFITDRPTTIEEVNRAFTEAVNDPSFNGTLKVSSAPLVSSDIIGNTASAIVDLPFTNVVDGNLIKVLAWYDNEWGYANRLVEMALEVSKVIGQ